MRDSRRNRQIWSRLHSTRSVSAVLAALLLAACPKDGTRLEVESGVRQGMLARSFGGVMDSAGDTVCWPDVAMRGVTKVDVRYSNGEGQGDAVGLTYRGAAIGRLALPNCTVGGPWSGACAEASTTIPRQEGTGELCLVGSGTGWIGALDYVDLGGSRPSASPTPSPSSSPSPSPTPCQGAGCDDDGECAEDQECEDGNLCTDDVCDDGSCRYVASESCGSIVPLYDGNTVLEPPLVEETATALVTRWGDRARDRHARESQFQAYEHYLSHYWEHRTAAVEIVDTVAKGGSTITFNVTTQWKLDDGQAELRLFFRGQNTVAEYHDNRTMTPIDDLHYTHSVSRNGREGRPLRIGDAMELELSQFLDTPPRGRENYYGTTMLYIVGKGLVPWEGAGPLRDSRPIPTRELLGGGTTVHRNESDEPDNLFLQMTQNLAPQNAPRFVRGRRVQHTSFEDGSHDEAAANPVWAAQAGKVGPFYVDESCTACHPNNGRALPPSAGGALERFLVRVGDAQGNPHPLLGAVLQPRGVGGLGEGEAILQAWTDEAGLRRPRFGFVGAAPTHFSARIAPPLVGLGLIEAIPEDSVVANADPDDEDGDGVSGRVSLVTDPESGVPRLGRFGWKASHATLRHQSAAAFRSEMGVTSRVFRDPDCGSSQSGCGSRGVEVSDADLDDLAAYLALLGVQARRDSDDPVVELGEALFTSAGCTGCHASTFVTTPFHPFAELAEQTVHPYSDLLLHDMGPGLASTLPEGNASGAEWRTPPLWGIGLTAGVSGGEAYLHDGRARTLREAILWHGGEGSRSRDAFESMPAADQEAMIAFLRSL